MKNKWIIDPVHNKILNLLFKDFNSTKKYKILDAGSGRTSLTFLTKKFGGSIVTALIYPGDERKKNGIKESAKSKNYILSESDIYKFSPKTKFNIVLAHLLLGEASKFSKKPFDKMLEALFKIKTDYLVVVDILDDPEVDYRKLLKFIANNKIIKIIYIDGYVGFLINRK